jgi:di/tripeptidase
MQIRDAARRPMCPATAGRMSLAAHRSTEAAPSADTVQLNAPGSGGKCPQSGDLVDRERVKNLFLELTQIPGPSFEERQVADTIKQKLADLGYEAREDEAGKKIGGNTGNLLVDIPGTVPDAPPLIFLCHMDTVGLAVGVKPQENGDTISSDGTTDLGGDDRAGNAEMLEMLRILKENNLPHPPIQVIFTVAEEAGLLGSKALDPKDVHGMLGFEADFFHPNEILWGSEWGDDGPDPDQTPHPRNPQEQFLEQFTFDSIRKIGQEPKKWDLPWASSDSASLRQMGIPALIIGAGEQDVHSEEEHIATTDIVDATRLMLTIVDRANQFKVDETGAIVPRTKVEQPPATEMEWQVHA